MTKYLISFDDGEEALQWAPKIAAACRCAQEIFELLPDPTV